MERSLLGNGHEIQEDEPEKAEQIRRIRLVHIHWSSVLLVVLGSLIAYGLLLAYDLVKPPPPGLTQSDLNAAVTSALAKATPSPLPAVKAYEQIRPALVQIQASAAADAQPQATMFGTGIVYDTSGAILTSLHIVAKATAIQVVFAEGTPSEATITHSSAANDIAILKPMRLPDHLAPATLGNPRTLQVGDEAIVVGNPLGLTASLTNGTISALGRTFPLVGSTIPLSSLIQFDAAVNPGNSGGPLLNRDGEVVGIVTGLANPTGQDQFAGIGFAVPIDSAMQAAGPPVQ